MSAACRGLCLATECSLPVRVHVRVHVCARFSIHLPRYSPPPSLSIPPDPCAIFSVSSFMHTDSETPPFMALHNAASLPPGLRNPNVARRSWREGEQGGWKGGGDVRRWRKRREVPVMTLALANINLIHLERREASH